MNRLNSALLLCVVVACSPAPPNPVTADEDDAEAIETEAQLESLSGADVDTQVEFGEPVGNAPGRLASSLDALAVDTKFGHFAFPETSAALGDAGRYRDTGRVVQLRTEAAAAFVAMQQAARDEGVNLVPISGFRTSAYQDGLFERAVGRYGSPEEAAVWVAPPGYSEHHTGLAIDIGDLNHPETDVEVPFETTPAFDWLKHNADRFGFELSFPDGNPQGVSYEPWHWRFIGELSTR